MSPHGVAIGTSTPSASISDAYDLAGALLGGVIAFEMARQLRGMSEQARLLAFFDRFPPRYPRIRHRVPRIIRSVVSMARTENHHGVGMIMLRPGKRGIYAREKAGQALREVVWFLQATR